MAKVVFTEPALDDLREIYRFIARDSWWAAESVVSRLVAGTERLADLPESGRLVPEVRPELGYREVIVRPYRVFYRFDGVTVLITAVIHGSRLVAADRVEEQVAGYGQRVWITAVVHGKRLLKADRPEEPIVAYG